MKLLNFCIITGENYMSKALTLYDSLKKHCDNFNLYYFCYDDITFTVLKKLITCNSNYKYIIPVEKNEYLNPTLLNIKATRQTNEFYWTLTPNILSFCIEKYNLPNLTYLDADIKFFNDPNILISELRSKNTIITKHNYSKEFEHLLYAGEFCVQFNTFLNEESSLLVLNDWKNKCNEWCFHKLEEGKFGDQGYLNVWPEKYKNVHVLMNQGGGVAPWNIKKFFFSNSDKTNYILTEIKTRENISLVFYHFQSVRTYFNNIFFIGNYKLSYQVVKKLYFNYFNELKRNTKLLKSIEPKLNPIGNINSFRKIPRILIDLVKRNSHINKFFIAPY